LTERRSGCADREIRSVELRMIQDVRGMAILVRPSAKRVKQSLDVAFDFSVSAVRFTLLCEILVSLAWLETSD
jgi:hypothetical protein